MAAAAALMVLVGGAIIWWLQSSSPAEERLPGPGPVRYVRGGLFTHLSGSASGQDRRVELDDGSTIEVSPGTTIRVVENHDTSVALELDPGHATFRIAPHGPRRWTVDAGQATVEVVGTVFTVERSDRGVEVRVERGRVRVTSDLIQAGGRVLAAGESVATFVEEPPEPAVDGGPFEQPGQGADVGIALGL